MIKEPQRDLPSGISGGSDLFDDLPILQSEYFNIVSTSSGIKFWNGSAWTTVNIRRWNGTSWEISVVKRWDGSQWVTI